MSARAGAWARARRAAATSTALGALAFGLSRCLLVAPERDELMSGAASVSASSGSASSAGTGGSGGAGATGGSGGQGGSGGAACNVELFWNAGVETQPGELVLDETDVYWATETTGGPSLVRRKAKTGDDDEGHVAAVLGTAGRFARQLSFYDGRLFWLGRGGGSKSAIETPVAEDQPPLSLWEADNGKYLAAGDMGLAWATSADSLVHIVAESGGEPVDGGTYAVSNAGTITALVAAGSVLIAAHSDGSNTRTLWRLAGDPPCDGCAKVVPSSEKASALRLDPTAATLYWLTGNGATRLIRYLNAAASGSGSPLIADPVAPDTEAVVVTSEHVLWMTDVFGGSFPDEYNEGIFHVKPKLNSQVATRLVPAPGCAWTCEDTSPARLVAADADHVYWSCVWQSQAVVYRAPLPP